MKKVFISIPMKGRSKEQIERTLERIKNIMTNMIDEDLEFINTEIKSESPKNAIWYLGQSISLMSEADIYVGYYKCTDFYGCQIEKEVALLYKMQYYLFDLYTLCPDIKKGKTNDRYRNY